MNYVETDRAKRYNRRAGKSQRKSSTPPWHLALVEDLMGKCLSDQQIIRQLSKPRDPDAPDGQIGSGGLGVHGMTVRRYLAIVYELWEKESAATDPMTKLREIARDKRMLADVYRSAIRDKDHFGALQARDRLNQRLGIEVDPKAQQVVISGDLSVQLDVSSARKALVGAVEKMIATREARKALAAASIDTTAEPANGTNGHGGNGHSK